MREPMWRQSGTDPDYRFSLANERTFLAWIRTALAILAGGVLLEQFSTRMGPHVLVLCFAVVLCALSAVLCGLAYLRWRANEIAMRHAERLPRSVAVPVLATCLLAVAGGIALLLASALGAP